MPRIRLLITHNLINITNGGITGITANERRLTGEEFLRGLKDSFEDHITTMNMTTDVLMYMDRVYCLDNRKASIFITSMGLFRDHILRSHLASTGSETITFDILNSVVLDQIGMERDGDVINKHLIKSCISILDSLYENDDENHEDKLYLTTFEPEFLRTSRKFYENECARLLRDSDCSTWLRQTKKRLSEEETRCQTTILPLSSVKIAKVVESEMISCHLTDFLAMEGSGIKAMINNDRYDDLTLLYELVSRIDPAKEPLKVALQGRVADLGGEINKMIQTTDFSAAAVVTTAEEGASIEGGEKSKAQKQNAVAKQTMAAIRWVDEVLRLKEKFDVMCTKCMNSDLILQTALTKSFSDFINVFPRCSEYVSLFIDDNLKRGIKGKTEAEIEEVLEKATTLVRYIQDRDMFERYYKKHLARRLLHGKSESQDAEKTMISRMKMELGNSFTAKLEGMFRDMSLSEEFTAKYRTHINDLGDLDRKRVDLGINVLTSNFWPMDSMGGGSSRREDGTQIVCNWPSEITNLQESFKSFYLKEKNGRRLTWLGYLGNADIRCTFPKVAGKEGLLGKERRYELNVPTYGMVVLMLFNNLADGETLSFDEIQEHTNIPVSDLSRILFTLAVLPKARVLIKNPASKDLPKSGDRFAINVTFISKAIKIKAPVISGGAINKIEGDDERKETEERNDEHRGNVIDTVLVRIMKYALHPHQNYMTNLQSEPGRRFHINISFPKSSLSYLRVSNQILT
jgi:cullin 3